jgi:ribonuclease VapC
VTLVFDAQALLAYFLDEPGAARVREMLKSVAAGQEEAWCGLVNLAEVRYVALRERPELADELVDWLLSIGVQPAGADATWWDAADIKAPRKGMSLADAFALATAKAKRATLVAGSDPDMEAANELGIKLVRV